jgi:hypothetical protein
LEELDDVAGGILEQDLGAARAGDDVVAERRSRLAQPANFGIDLVDDEVGAVPAAGPGLAPSGIGRPAELVGPLSSSRRLPRRTSANAGAKSDSTPNPRCFV